MRIVGGICGGRHISPPSSIKARPTTDFAKESLFNILTNRYDYTELNVLDLFAGTGNISFEFASRGAVSVLSVEKYLPHSHFIRKTAEKLNLMNIKVINTDALRFIKNCYEKYDIVFADPPYDMNEVGEIPSMVKEKEILRENGIFILEHSKMYDFSQAMGAFEKRNYGNVHFTFFQF